MMKQSNSVEVVLAWLPQFKILRCIFFSQTKGIGIFSPVRVLAFICLLKHLDLDSVFDCA